MTATSSPPSQSRDARERQLPWLAVISLLALTLLLLRLEGRIWWCACRTPTPFSVHVHSSHNSQHLFDPYSFSHLLHGIIFFWVLYLLLPRIQFGWRLLIALAIEAGWEVLENSPLIIARYRAATASLGYSGDTIVNSTGDVLSCAFGFVLARYVGWRWSIAVFVAIELIMLLLIRDNLTLNVIMLFIPIEGIKSGRWGHDASQDRKNEPVRQVDRQSTRDCATAGSSSRASARKGTVGKPTVAEIPYFRIAHSERCVIPAA